MSTYKEQKYCPNDSGLVLFFLVRILVQNSFLSTDFESDSNTADSLPGKVSLVHLPHVSIAPPHPKWRPKMSCNSSNKICMTKASAF